MKLKKIKHKKQITRIYLVRHAHPAYHLQRKNYFKDHLMPLSDIGIKESRKVSCELLKKKITKIYASNFLRSYETARPLSEKLGKNIEKEKDLEEIDWQSWVKIEYFRISEEKRRMQIPEYKKLKKELSVHQTIAKRMLGRIYQAHAGEHIAVFTHGNIIRAMITSVLGSHVVGFLSLQISLASISCIEIDVDKFVQVKYTNHTKHLN